MSGIRHVAALVAVGLCALALSTALVAVAETHIVVDADGSVEDYAAITTILQHPDYGNRLCLISVSGATWGYGPTVVRNLCRFVALAGAADTTAVALGEIASTSDAFQLRSHAGDCADVQGFPATPHDAALRGMPYSRADVTSAYGQTYTLPHLKTSAASCGYTVGTATQSFLTLLRQSDADRDSIVYLQLGSATNLAAYAAAVQGQGSASLLHKFYRVVEVHVFETGYSGGADNTSMVEVLAAATSDSQTLRVRLYPPLFYNPGVTFNVQSWSMLGTIASTAGTAKAVTWLYKAWERKKALLDAQNYNDFGAFFRERGPASSLVVLCALEESMRNLCQSYRTPARKLHMVALTPPTPTTPAESVITVTGNNVTAPFYYLVTGKTDGDVTVASSFVYNVAAATRVGGNSESLVDVFWARWFDVLRM